MFVYHCDMDSVLSGAASRLSFSDSRLKGAALCFDFVSKYKKVEVVKNERIESQLSFTDT